MNIGAMLAVIGSVAALLGINVGAGVGQPGDAWLQRLFSAIYVEEFGQRGIGGLQLWTGQLSAVLALAAVGLSVAVWRGRNRQAATAQILVGLSQVALAWLTWDRAESLVPCSSLLGAFCASDGGLVPGTWLQLNGLSWLVLGGALTAIGGTLAAVAPAEYAAEQRFLRVALLWGEQVVHARVFFAPQPVTMGERGENTFQVAAGGLARHQLFAPLAADRYVLSVPEGLLARVHCSSGHGEPREVAGEALVQRGDSGELALDNGLFLQFAFVQPETAVLARQGGRGSDALGWSFGAVALALLVICVASAASPLTDPDDAGREALATKNRGLVEVSLAQEEQLPEPPPVTGEDIDTTGKKAAGEEGKLGVPQADPTHTTQVPKRSGPLADHVDVRELGVAKALAAPTGALSIILAGDSDRFQDKLAVATSGEGTEQDYGPGKDAMGFRDLGHGGGGDQLGRIHGQMPLDTGDGVGKHANVGLAPKARKHVGDVKLTEAVQHTSGCDKGDISKNVRMRAASLRACYETELMPHPDLQGKLTVQWTIAEDGSVTGDRVVSDSLASQRVSECVLRAIRRIHFQKPEAGTCVVQWPFVFNPG